jgi:hypothetical protein
MEARKEKGFGVSAETAPLVIEAILLYARMHRGALRAKQRLVRPVLLYLPTRRSRCISI